MEKILSKLKKQKDGSWKNDDGIVCIEMDDLAYKLLISTLKINEEKKDMR